VYYVILMRKNIDEIKKCACHYAYNSGKVDKHLLFRYDEKHAWDFVIFPSKPLYARRSVFDHCLRLTETYLL
jgi:hypothetical protein